VSFDAGAKAKVIKEVKALLGLSLVESKKFVEVSLPLPEMGMEDGEGWAGDGDFY
jgi:large subunit ribosomal protein L7/L12